MVLTGILIGLIAAIVFMESRIGGQNMLDRPIIMAPLIGLVMGDFQTGLIIGGTLELVWIGAVGIGTAVPPDTIVGSALATAFSIHSGASVESALALAIPIALLAQLVQILVNTINSTFVHMADRAAAKGEFAGVNASVWLGAALYFVSKFLLVFFGFILGADAFTALVEKIPLVLSDGLRTGTSLLPALGIAMLLLITTDKKFNILIVLGFVLSAYLGLNTMAVALVGLVIGVLFFNLKPQTKEVDF